MYSSKNKTKNYYCRICEEYYYDTCFMHYMIKDSGELNYD